MVKFLPQRDARMQWDLLASHRTTVFFRPQHSVGHEQEAKMVNRVFPHLKHFRRFMKVILLGIHWSESIYSPNLYLGRADPRFLDA